MMRVLGAPSYSFAWGYKILSLVFRLSNATGKTSDLTEYRQYAVKCKTLPLQTDPLSERLSRDTTPANPVTEPR